MVTEITKENFNKEVLMSEKPVLLDFWAAWCGPCMMLSPVIEELGKEYKDEYKICKINVDNEMELSQKFNVMSIPTLIVFKNGKEHKKSVGVKSKNDILTLFK